MVFDLYDVFITLFVNLTNNLTGSFFLWLLIFVRLLHIWSLSLDKSESLDNESDNSCFVIFQCFFFLSRPLFLDFLYLMSLDGSDFLDDESDNDGSDSGSSGTFNFTLCFYDSVGRVGGVGYGIFVPIGFKSKCDVVTFLCSYQ